MATQMASTATKAAENAIKLGEQAMQGMAQTAMTGTQLVILFDIKSFFKSLHLFWFKKLVKHDQN